MRTKPPQRFDAFCPICNEALWPLKSQIGETLICTDTGKEFVLTADMPGAFERKQREANVSLKDQ